MTPRSCTVWDSFADIQDPAAGLALAAGQRSMQVGAAEFPHPQGVAFEVVGVDFLVDRALQPWLLEFNAVPSMARQVKAALPQCIGHGCVFRINLRTVACKYFALSPVSHCCCVLSRCYSGRAPMGARLQMPLIGRRRR